MEAATHPHDHHHEMPTEGAALTKVAISATLHCLTGCAIGEVLGMVIGTALGFSDWGTVGLAVALAFFFGYALTSLPLLRAGLALAAVVPIALASDTLSIATMEIVDNAIMLAVPGAMEAGVGDVLFWGALSVALAIAGVVAMPVNRYLIARGKGHAVVHETGIHGGPSPRTVSIVAAVAFVFGATVLIAELVSSDGEAGHGGGHAAETAEPARGLSASDGDLSLQLASSQLPRGERAELSFQVKGEDGNAVSDFEVEHEKRMHLIVVRRDMTGFQHLHPSIAADGTWSTPITLAEPGSYRVFADFNREGENHTLAGDVTVAGSSQDQPLPPASNTAAAGDGYDVRLKGEGTSLEFEVTRDGQAVETEPYLGAGGHLVTLREGDLAYVHTHPSEHEEGGHGSGVKFESEFPGDGRYRLFFQFKHDGKVRTAAFTRDVG